MTFEAVYCPECCRCYPRNGDGNTFLVPCDHSTKKMVRLDLDVVGRHEHVKMWTPDKWPVRFWLRPDGNGGRYVEYKLGKAKNPRLYSLSAFLATLRAKSPTLVAAFEARRDVRRGAVGSGIEG